MGGAGDAPWSIAWHKGQLPKATLLGSGRKLRARIDKGRLEIEGLESWQHVETNGMAVVKLTL